jgi:hypothetical protein
MIDGARTGDGGGLASSAARPSTIMDRRQRRLNANKVSRTRANTLLYAVCNVIIFQVARTRQLAAPSCVAASCCSSISCIIDHLFGPV